ncbi:hypothetical protein [uncultured Flavobacterium sp.]|uniref:hypothetical protein n=1 Tax=uncultured Flavobacterium sp. TaxID=165435 RepID=UPI0030EF7949|tara:strand:- start:81917 stop:82168 length:252 start_codon:yes stop_codon:yes gene_type:complete
MKKLYFLVVLAMSFATQAQIVNIPDANFKANLLGASSSNYTASTIASPFASPGNNFVKIDTNNDGEIQVSEALAIKYLKISSG